MRKLTEAEVNHIKHLLNMNVETGEYYGNQKHYWKRHNTLDELFTNEY